MSLIVINYKKCYDILRLHLIGLSFKTLLSILFTCSAADGFFSRIACAALLFLAVRAAAKGDMPLLSRADKSMFGCVRRRDMIAAC